MTTCFNASIIDICNVTAIPRRPHLIFIRFGLDLIIALHILVLISTFIGLTVSSPHIGIAYTQSKLSLLQEPALYKNFALSTKYIEVVQLNPPCSTDVKLKRVSAFGGANFMIILLLALNHCGDHSA